LLEEPQSLTLSNYELFIWLMDVQINCTGSQKWLNSPHVKDSFAEWRRRDTGLLQPPLNPSSKHFSLHSDILGLFIEHNEGKLKNRDNRNIITQ
jgi:hypothetical protein